MPALKNPRWEIFVQGRAEGMAISDAYILAGFKVKSREVAFAAGARLLRNVPVKARLRELIDLRAETVVVTKESIAAELDAAAEQAALLDQPSARIAAATAKAKLFGVEAPTRNLNVNLSGTFSQLTDDEMRYEVASMVNELRSVKGQPPIPLPAKKDDA
jgi:hypothetical protein